MAATASRRFEALQTEVDPEKLYEPVEACSLVKKLASAKFVETGKCAKRIKWDEAK